MSPAFSHLDFLKHMQVTSLFWSFTPKSMHTLTGSEHVYAGFPLFIAHFVRRQLLGVLCA